MPRIIFVILSILIGCLLGPFVAFFPSTLIPHALIAVYTLGFGKAVIGSAVFAFTFAFLPKTYICKFNGLPANNRAIVVALFGIALGPFISGGVNLAQSKTPFNEGFAFLASVWAGFVIASLIWVFTGPLLTRFCSKNECRNALR